ncbi:mediator complex subunit [Tulasnella sp. 419]|nr:mediator complex subunit [Tulasnella sp. 419]
MNRRSPPTGSPQQQRRANPPPLLGGTLTFKIAVNTKPQNREAASKRHVNKILAELQQKTTFGATQEATKRPSDTPDDASIIAEWQPTQFALAVNVRREDVTMDIVVDANNLDFPEILKQVTLKHSRAILRTVQQQLLQGSGGRHIFSDQADIEVIEDANSGSELRVRLCGSQSIIIAIDYRTGKFVFRDFGDFATSARSLKFERISKPVNNDPAQLIGMIMMKKYLTILETIEHQANYLGLQNTRLRPFADSEMAKFGPNIRTSLYMGLTPYPGYYLVMLAAEDGLKWALVNVRDNSGRTRSSRVIGDWGWLDVDKIGGEDRWGEIIAEEQHKGSGAKLNQRNAGSSSSVGPQRSFAVRTEVLRELYAFCCARVSHTKVEQQLKSKGIPCRPFFPCARRNKTRKGLDGHELTSSRAEASDDSCALTPYSSTARSVPMIWIRAHDIFQTKSVADVAYENIKIKVVDWWSERPVRVITSLMLKEAPPLSDIDAKRKAASSESLVTRPSKNITYDPATSIVSFVSYNVETCVTEFLEEWDRIRRVVSLVRELGKVKRKMGWHDVQILRFDLQTVELAYHSNCVMSVQWVPAVAGDNQTAAGGTYEMTFSAIAKDRGFEANPSDFNPHSDLAVFLSRSFQHDAERSMGVAVKHLLLTLRNTLPVIKQLYAVKRSGAGEVIMLLKSPTWFRLLYRTKFAFDFRVLADGQVAISEVATSFLSVRSAAPGTDKPRPFETLPGLNDITKEVAQECGTKTTKATLPPVIHTSNGLICKGPRLEDVIAQLHAKILARVQGLGPVSS